MTMKIRTPHSRLTVRAHPSHGRRWLLAPVPANDGAREEAAALLSRALSKLDASGALIAAAHVDQALVSLRQERPTREGG